MLEEVVMLRRAGASISASRVDRYAAELERLQKRADSATRDDRKVLDIDRKNGRAVKSAHLRLCHGALRSHFVRNLVHFSDECAFDFSGPRSKPRQMPCSECV